MIGAPAILMLTFVVADSRAPLTMLGYVKVDLGPGDIACARGSVANVGGASVKLYLTRCVKMTLSPCLKTISSSPLCYRTSLAMSVSSLNRYCNFHSPHSSDPASPGLKDI